MRVTLLTLAGLFLYSFASTVMAQTENTTPRSGNDDHLIWMEEVEGERALTWVRTQNERTLADLQSDPRYNAYENAAKTILTSKERIPYGRIRGGHVYNFWQDQENVRGLWRRASRESYSTEEPVWETLVDFDTLAEEEGKNWVFKGSSTFHDKKTDKYHTLVSLSDGGKDAVIKREFDTEQKQFVTEGFVTPEAKQNIEWIGPDTLLIGTDWGKGSLTESGYPRILKKWKRGTPLSEAETVIEVDQSDVAVSPFSIELEDGTILAHAEEADTFFTSTYWWLPENESDPVKYPIPSKSEIEGIYQGQLFVALKEDWAPEGQKTSFQSGDLVSFPLKQFIETRSLPEVELVFHPNQRQALDQVAITKGAVMLAISEDVIGKILRVERRENEWDYEPVALPGKGQPGITFSDDEEETVFLNYEDFLTPDSLLEYNSKTKELKTLKSLPPKFDAEGLIVKQHFTESKDGTKIPYFVIHREDIAFDESTPTLLYSYGGFQISLRPGYSGTIGKLWLENGGAYVLANIRGGGEYGPAWHQAGLKLNRQRIYDDFIAVGEAVIASGLTSPPHLGIMGGSNGGLLMGVMLNQRPDLWNAVVVQVPLLDMFRYHTLLAGASWVDEYGSPDVPEERAFLETISPYHNFREEKEYPAPFFVTSTKDDRVHPCHARKMAKLFEESDKPFFYYENIDGGHSAAANQTERAKRTALEYIYLTRRLMDDSSE
ncbi:prolyl oligopeptidase family serine peptidase [Verrucomicrobiales bacterium]|jgi:prolyl oligopeptidase|nr:prolyl oligopeptidase family serine peptidase [Verrucomicrobiales bacterium]